MKILKKCLWLFRDIKNLPKVRIFSRERIMPIVRHNRATLAKVERWIEDDIYNNSIFQYGLPPHTKELVDKDIGEGLTYSDVIIYLSRFLKKRVGYLEIGVSVGKNLLQVVNSVKNSTVTGFDFEEINPVLERFLEKPYLVDEWETIPDSLKKSKSSLTKYHYSPNNNRVFYLCGDVNDENSWKRLSGMKFNVIFSDAKHNPDMLVFEHEMIKKYELMDESEFILFWDDLGGKMTAAYREVLSKLTKKYNLHRDSSLILLLNGWIGRNERKHKIGIIMKPKIPKKGASISHERE